MLLLFTDTHLTDQPADEYRWEVFNHVRQAAKDYEVTSITNLGDMVDRKDRFTAKFVNRLNSEIKLISKLAPLDIMMGNHDNPLNGQAFFEFLNDFEHEVRYITKPTFCGKLILLPYTHNPIKDWAAIKFDTFDAAFMHATVTGARSESGFELSGGKFPPFPPKLKIYSGDVHQPQTVGQVTYVGTQHPIKYGDKGPFRMLLLDPKTFDIVKEIRIDAARKLVLDVTSLADLEGIDVRPGDQIRVRFAVGSGDVSKWGDVEQGIEAWAQSKGVDVTGLEASITRQSVSESLDIDLKPDATLRLFAKDENIDPALLDVGLDILNGLQQ